MAGKRDDTLDSHSNRAIIVMGVSGCGKSTIAAQLASAFGLAFVEGDLLHPPANIAKMAEGIALTDADRWPWLTTIGHTMAEALAGGDGIVVSCSALKRAYRDLLRETCDGQLDFVYLQGTPAVLEARMRARQGHFMPTALLTSQLAALEVPTGEPGVITISIDQSVDAMVEEALSALSHCG